VAKRPPILSSNQPDLFQQVAGHVPTLEQENAPDLDIEAELLGALRYALREAKKRGLSRERVVERMNLCLPEGQRITKRQLDAWCAESKEFHRIPAALLPAVVWACGVADPVEVITRALGLVTIDEAETLATELGQTVSARVQLGRRERELKRRLGG